MNPTLLLINWALKSILVASIGLFAVRIMRHGTAGVRYRTLGLTLLAVCLVPLASNVGPHWTIPYLTVEEPRPALAKVSMGESFLPGQVPATRTPDEPSQPEPVGLSKLEPVLLLAGLWCLGTVLFAFRLGGRLMRLKRFEKTLPMLDRPELVELVAGLCSNAGHQVLLLSGPENQPPMTWGQARPVLLLPSDATGWSEEQVRSVVLHELAHIERSDWLKGVFAQVVCTVFWFNPAIWLVVKRMELESELAADQRVLSQGVSGPKYASHLLHIARRMKAASAVAHVAVAMARNSRLNERVFAILAFNGRPAAPRGFAMIGSLMVGTAGFLVTVLASPTVVKHTLMLPVEVRPRVRLESANNSPRTILPLLPSRPRLKVQVAPRTKHGVVPYEVPANAVRVGNHRFAVRKFVNMKAPLTAHGVEAMVTLGTHLAEDVGKIVQSNLIASDCAGNPGQLQALNLRSKDEDLVHGVRAHELGPNEKRPDELRPDELRPDELRPDELRAGEFGGDEGAETARQLEEAAKQIQKGTKAVPTKIELDGKTSRAIREAVEEARQEFAGQHLNRKLRVLDKATFQLVKAALSQANLAAQSELKFRALDDETGIQAIAHSQP